MEKLPLEILHMIVHEIPRQKDRASLSEVSRYMHQALIPLLYRKRILIVPVPAKCRHELDRLSVKTFFRGDGSRDIFNSLNFLKELKLVAPILDPQENRCHNGRHLVTGKILSHDEFLGKLNTNFQRTFFHLPRNSLKSFFWHLGYCVPSQIFDYLSSTQHQIHDLSLITDGTCTHSGMTPDRPLKFTELRSLSWKGLFPGDHDGTLRMVLAANSKHLEYLELETVGHLDYDSLHVNNIINGWIMCKDTTKFSSLQHLCLSHVDLGTAYQGIASAFRTEQLQSLKLRKCSNTLLFLKELARPSRTFKLRSFEIVFDEETTDELYTEMHPLGLFLESFKGLEELCISLHNAVCPMYTFLKPIFHHKRSLKRLVHHEKGWVESEERDRYLLLCDDLLPWNSVFGRTLLLLASLECIGVCLPPPLLRQELEPKAANYTFKLLHLRITGTDYSPENVIFKSVGSGSQIPFYDIRFSLDAYAKLELCSIQDLLDFAEWAFSPNGLPNLMVIACGDFSHGRRFKWTQLLLTRNPDPSTDVSLQPRYFRTWSGTDYIHILDEIDGAREMLSTCPTEPILKFDVNDRDSAHMLDDISD